VAGLVVVALTISATGGCGAFGGTPVASRAEMIVLGDVSPSGLALADEQRRHVVDVVVPLAIERRAEVVLARIDEAAYAAPEIVARVGFDTAAAEGNQIAEDRIVADGRRELRAAVERLLDDHRDAPVPASDVAGALRWAAETLGGADGGSGGGGAGADGRPWRGIVLLSDAVSTAPPCNLTLAPPPASGDVAGVVGMCFPGGMPDLSGVEVSFLGANSYPPGEPPPVDPLGLQRFWQAVVEGGHGTVARFGATAL
jgi:hypothetical protein